MSSRIVFTEGNHRYSLDGRWCPGVTSATKFASRSDGLINWAATEAANWAATHVGELQSLGEEKWIEAAAKAHADARDASMRAGKQVHQLAEALVYGNELPPETPEGLPWPDDVFRTAQQLARFYDAWDVTPVLHEGIVFHEQHWWAGRFDLIADMAGERWLLDYKTGRTGVWAETALQLNAYARATHVQYLGEDRPMLPVQRLGAVWLRPDNWQLIPVAYSDDLYTVFGHAMRVRDWVSTRSKSAVMPPLNPPDTKEAS